MPLQPWPCRAPTQGGAAIPRPARGPSAWRGAHGGQATCRAISKPSQEVWGWPWGRAGMAEQKSLGTGTPRHLPRVFRPVTQHRGGCGGHGVLRPLWIAGTPPGFKGQTRAFFPCPGVLLTVLPHPSISCLQRPSSSRAPPASSGAPRQPPAGLWGGLEQPRAPKSLLQDPESQPWRSQSSTRGRGRVPGTLLLLLLAQTPRDAAAAPNRNAKTRSFPRDPPSS